MLSVAVGVVAAVFLNTPNGKPRIGTRNELAYREPLRRLWVEGRDIWCVTFTPDQRLPATGQPHPYLLRRDAGGQFLGIEWTRDSQVILDRQSPTGLGHGGRCWMFRLPLWWPLALSLPLPTLWLGLALRNRRRKPPGLCPACGYDLRAAPDRCPECGAPAPARPQ